MRNMCEARPNGSANRFFRRRTRFARMSESGWEELNQQAGYREHDRGDDQKICRPDVFNKMLGNIGTENGAKRSADGDETIQPFALLDREQIGYECPEDGGVK